MFIYVNNIFIIINIRIRGTFCYEVMKLANINQVFFDKKLNLLKICKKGQNSPLPPKLLLNNYVFSRLLYTSITRA